MYLVPEWSPDDELPGLTSRQRHEVATTAVMLADWAHDATDEIGDQQIHATTATSLLSELPPCIWQQNLVWRRQMARTFDDLADDAQSGANPLPRCTGEEMALHIVLIKSARQHLDGELDHLLAAIPSPSERHRLDQPDGLSVRRLQRADPVRHCTRPDRRRPQPGTGVLVHRIRRRRRPRSSARIRR